MQDRDVISFLREVLDVMRGHQNPHLTGERREHVAKRSALLRIQTCGRLVQQQNLSVVDKRGCNAQAS